MKNNELQAILDEQNVSKENAKQLLDAFGAPFTEAGEILADYITEDDEGNPTLTLAESAIRVTDEEDFAAMAEAREKRIKLMHIRTGVEGKRKELKEDSLRVGRAIDAAAKAIKTPVKIVEEYLETQEKFAEIRAAERAAKLKAERIEKLMQYTNDISMYNFEQMTDEQFDALLATLNAQKDAEIAAAKKAEEDRLAAIEAEKKRQAEIEAENERLKKAAEQREIEQAKIRARINKITALGLSYNMGNDKYHYSSYIYISSAQIEKSDDGTFNRLLSDLTKQVNEFNEAQRKAEAEAKAKHEAELAKERAAAEAERKKREDLEKAEHERKAAEAKTKADAEEAQRQALLAPDKEKLLSFNNALGIIQKEKLPAVKTKQGQDVVNLIDDMLTKMQAIITERAANL